MTPQNKRWGIATLSLLALGGIAAATIHFGFRPGADPEYRSMALPVYDALYRASQDLDSDDYWLAFQRDLEIASDLSRKMEGRASDRQKSTESYRSLIESLNALQEVADDQVKASQARKDAVFGVANHVLNAGGTKEQAAAAETREGNNAMKVFDSARRDAAGRADTLLRTAKNALDAKD